MAESVTDYDRHGINIFCSCDGKDLDHLLNVRCKECGCGRRVKGIWWVDHEVTCPGEAEKRKAKEKKGSKWNVKKEW